MNSAFPGDTAGGHHDNGGGSDLCGNYILTGPQDSGTGLDSPGFLWFLGAARLEPLLRQILALGFKVWSVVASVGLNHIRKNTDRVLRAPPRR